MLDAFHASRGLAIDVPMGLVDFIEVLQFTQLGTDLFYDFLNMGFRLNPVAGSDFPYINLPGTERSYVHVKGGFSPQTWFEELQRGRTFVTTAPILSLSVAGKSMGEELRVNSGDAIEISASVRINPDFGRMTRLELVLHGDVVADVRPEYPAEALVLQHQLTAKNSCWLAVRAYGENGAVAHSAPVYVIVDGVDAFWKPAEVRALVEKYKRKLTELTSSLPKIYEDLEKWDTAELMLPVWREQLPALKKQAALARQRYDAILKAL
jgi:hypothetical protein